MANTKRDPRHILGIVQEALNNERHPSFRKFNVIVHGIDYKDENGDTALHLAAACKLVGTVKLLLDHGADVNIRDHKNFTSLYFASMGIPDYEVYKLLIEYGGDPDVEVNGTKLTSRKIVESFIQDKEKELAEKFKKLLAQNSKPSSR